MRNLAVFFFVAVTLALAMLIGIVRHAGDAGSPPPAVSTGAAPAPPADQGIPHIGRIQILNGCGIDGIAWKVAEYLRNRGFDVKNDGIDNAPSFNYPATLVVSRTADPRIAHQVGKALGLDQERVLVLRDGAGRFDATVFVGPDILGKVE